MNDLPINEYYKDSIIDSLTIKKTYKTWVAILILEDPRNSSIFVRIYEWKKDKNGAWKRRGVVTLNKAEEIKKSIEMMEKSFHKIAEFKSKKIFEQNKKPRS